MGSFRLNETAPRCGFGLNELLVCLRLSKELRLVCDAEGNVNRRGDRACRLQMTRLVMEEDT